MSLVAPEAADSKMTMFGAVAVAAAAAAAVGEELPGEDKGPIVDMVVAAGVAAARRVLGLRSGALRAAAVAAAVGRGSRTTLGQLEVVM